MVLSRSIPARAGEPGNRVLPNLDQPVYPRACGGTKPSAEESVSAQGLSPRVRGNPAASWTDGTGDRSIPACAGEPMPGRAQKTARWVYPRVCGGTEYPYLLIDQDWGLSPRVRGNQTSRRGTCACRRSIPACAGEPANPFFRFSQAQVYPRVCGGTDEWQNMTAAGVGLSPRVRGNHPNCRIATKLLGSIPACAGEPIPGCRYPAATGVYPRVCGGTGRISTSPSTR